MVAFNFHNHFADDVESGRKTNTIRKSAKCKVGDKLQLYTGQRTKQCRKLGEGICTKVREVEITPECVFIFYPDGAEMKIISDEKKDAFAEKFGFTSYDAACDFYDEYHGLPFHGWWHSWELINNKPDNAIKGE